MFCSSSPKELAEIQGLQREKVMSAFRAAGRQVEAHQARPHRPEKDQEKSANCSLL